MRSSIWAQYQRAVKCGQKVNGKQYGRFPVRASWSGMDRDLWEDEVTAVVIAESAAAAANYWLDYWAARVDHPVEVEAVGYRGGVVHRFAGWESLIGRQLFAGVPAAKQEALPLGPEVKGKRDWVRWLQFDPVGQWFSAARRRQSATAQA